MRFLLFASYLPSVINFRSELINLLQVHSCEVHVVAPKISSHILIRNQLSEMGIIVHEITLSRTGINPIKDAYSLILLFNLILRIRPRYILSYTIKPVIYGMLVAYLLKVPTRFALITGLGFNFTGKANRLISLMRVFLKMVYRFSLQKSSKVFFQNPDDKYYFESIKILKQSHPSVVINGSGVNLDHFSVAPLPINISFLMVARLLGDKGIREYIYAAKLIKKKHPNINFSLVGWIDEHPDAIKQKDLDDWVNDGIISFLGKLEDVRPAISDCCVYVLPSYREGTPRTVLEAMAMGRPIITTDAPGCRETVINGKNGFLVPVKSIDALVEAMLKFIKNPELCIHMGKKSRLLAEEKYDVNKVNAVMLKEMGII